MKMPTNQNKIIWVLLGKKLDISNFPKKLIALGLLKKLSELKQPP
jgi:hypothetical protein